MKHDPSNHPIVDSRVDEVAGRPGDHPVSSGVGAVGGALAGAGIGAAVTVFAAPIGALVGGLVGGVVGGIAGEDMAEAVSGDDQEAYWRAHYESRDPLLADETYDDFRPAYRYGWEVAVRNPGMSFEQAEPYMKRNWDQARGSSKLDWEHAQSAAKEAWTKVQTQASAKPR